MKNIILSKDQISKYLFLVFFFTVFALAGYNHLFTSKKRTQIVPSSLSNPIEPTLIQNLELIELKNPRLNVTLNRREGSWILTQPKKFPLQAEIIKKITDTLKKIKITKIYPDDTLNRETFRVNTGLSSLKINSQDEAQEIIFGLNNSVDQTSYIRLSGQNTIFQIEALNLDFANIVLNDLIDINLFSYSNNDLSEVTINRGTQTKWPKIGILKNNEGLWINTYKRKLNQDKVKSYLEKLRSIRFSHLIDERAEDLESNLDKIFKYPMYNLSFNYRNKKIGAFISKPIKYDIPSLNIEKDRFVMIKFNNTTLLYLMPKQNLEFFDKFLTKELR